MNIKTFIEQYCLIKDKENNVHHIKLKDYQIKFLELYEQSKKKTGTVSFDSQNYKCRIDRFIRAWREMGRF